MRHLILFLALVSNLSFGITGNKVWRVPSGGAIPSWGPVNLADNVNAVTGLLSRANLEAVGEVITSSSGSFSTTTTADVTNLSATLTTTGRPVVAMLFAAGGTTASGIVSAGSSSQVYMYLDATNVFRTNQAAAGVQTPCSGIYYVSTPAAGSHTWKITAVPGSGSPAYQFIECKLAVYEL